MQLVNVNFVSDTAFLIELEIHGLGVVDLYNETKLVEYAWSFSEGTFRATFQICGSTAAVDLVFAGARNIEAFQEPGPLPEASNLEFEYFTFGEQYLDWELEVPLKPADQRNVEISTNLTTYRFWADSLQASVVQDGTALIR